MINDADLEDFRAAQVEEFRDSMSIIRNVESTGDGIGGPTYITSETGPFPCSLDLRSGDESEINGGVREIGRSTLRFPVTVDLGVKDRVEISGRSYEVTWVGESRANETARHAQVVRL